MTFQHFDCAYRLFITLRSDLEKKPFPMDGKTYCCFLTEVLLSVVISINTTV